MTKEEGINAIVQAVADLIREIGSIPSGHLYARLMPWMTLDAYTMVIGVLKNGGLIEEKAHLITWIGPGRTRMEDEIVNGMPDSAVPKGILNQ